VRTSEVTSFGDLPTYELRFPFILYMHVGILRLVLKLSAPTEISASALLGETQKVSWIEMNRWGSVSLKQHSMISGITFTDVQPPR
jgi:hypothetical protein